MYENLKIFSYDENFFQYSDIINAIKQSGINLGDYVFLHSDVTKFGRLEDIKDKNLFNQVFLDACLECVGENGHLIIPTFSYSYGDRFNAKKFFDVDQTPSILNPLTEIARHNKDFSRTIEPMLSVVIKGPNSDELVRDISENCLGSGSIWERLLDINTNNLLLGFKFDTTMLHYIENISQVPYRKNIVLSGILKTKHGEKNYSVNYFAHDRSFKIDYSREKLYKKCISTNSLSEVKLGAGSIMNISSKNLYKNCRQLLQNDPFGLVQKL